MKWEFNKGEEGFTGDNCSDLGVRNVQVELDGNGIHREAADRCSGRQVVFQNIPAGEYTLTVRPLDEDGILLTSRPVEATGSYDGGTWEETVVNVADSEWAVPLSGTFYFRLSWNGQDCSAANPPVVMHRLSLWVDGNLVPLKTQEGQPLDGTEPAGCVSMLEAYPQAVLGVPFGPAELEVVGIDKNGVPRYKQMFKTFVGAGLTNPEFSYDVGRAP